MSSSGHREIEHTADLGFEVWARDRDTLLREATDAMCELCFERDSVRPLREHRLEVRGDGFEQCLVRWLQGVYLRVEMHGWLTAGAADLSYRPGRVEGILRGEPFDATRHTVHAEIKAITYHALAVERGEDGLYRTMVILDV